MKKLTLQTWINDALEDIFPVTKSDLVLREDNTSIEESLLNIEKPNTVDPLLLDDKLNPAYFPDVIFGQLQYGGAFNDNNVITGSPFYELTGINLDTASVSSLAGFYFIYQGPTENHLFKNDYYSVGDWAVCNGALAFGNEWSKVKNTDAVTGVKGDAESVYRKGQINLTPSNIGAVSLTASEEIAGNKTFLNDIKSNYGVTAPIIVGTGIGAFKTISCVKGGEISETIFKLQDSSTILFGHQNYSLHLKGNGIHPIYEDNDGTNYEIALLDDLNSLNIPTTAADIGAVSLTGNQTINGNKTFANSVKSSNSVSAPIIAGENFGVFPAIRPMQGSVTADSYAYQSLSTESGWINCFGDETLGLCLRGSEERPIYKNASGDNLIFAMLSDIPNDVQHAQDADYALQLAVSPTIDGVEFKGNDNIHHFTTCSTASATAAKTATKTGFELAEGAEITIKFDYANTANSPTLKIGSTAAKPIKADGDTVYVKWIAGAIMKFVYDGTYWVCMAGYQLAGKRVGEVITRHDSTNPGTLYGGTWTAIEGRVIVGYGVTTNNPAYKGTYSATTQYYPHDIVLRSGSYYLCTAPTSGNAPPNTTYWVSYVAGTRSGKISHNHASGSIRALLTDTDTGIDFKQSNSGSAWAATTLVKFQSETSSSAEHTWGVETNGDTADAYSMMPYDVEYVWYRTA